MVFKYHFPSFLTYLLNYLLTYLITYLLTYLLTYLSWEANRFSTSKEIPHILRKPKVHYRSHKCLPPVPIQYYVPVHNIYMSYFCHGKFGAAQLLFRDDIAVYNYISRQYFKTVRIDLFHFDRASYYRLISFTNFNAQFLYSLTIRMLHYNPRHVSSINMPIFRRTNCIITASGIITLCKRLYSMPGDSRLLCSLLSPGILYCTVHRMTIPDAVIIQFVLLKMGMLMLETCRGL